MPALLRLVGPGLALLLVAALAAASETGLSGAEGHPRTRFPLALHVARFPDAALDAAARRAVREWNAVFREALETEAFAEVDDTSRAQILVSFEASPSPKMMGVTYLAAVGGVLELPVRIAVYEPRARGETVPEIVLFQVVAHELGHALGLGHTRDPRSLMCCVTGSIDFNDPLARDAYIEGRRHPRVASVQAQVAEHYRRFWAVPR